MKKTLLTSLLLLIFQLSFSQKKAFKSIHCYEGVVKDNNIIWNTENLQCFNYKIKIKNKKVLIKQNLKRQKFDIIEFSGSDKYDGSDRDTWLCYDRRNNEKCYIYHLKSDNNSPEEEIYFEYKESVFCFRVIK
jgi:hypothetical protein